MSGRLEGKICIVVGGGQTPGLTVGNGKATAIRFAQEGGIVMVADRNLESAKETCAAIDSEGGKSSPVEVDILDESAIKRMVALCRERHGRIDVLHNNVGVEGAAGDTSIETITQDAFDRVYSVNLRGMAMTCKHVLPIMKEQRSGVIINIGSMSAYTNHPTVAYKTSKAGVSALTQHIAILVAKYGVRANCILPGTIQTPMALDAQAERKGISRDDLSAFRDKRVPLRGKQGSAWDVANAALFLASDEANFITGINLPVDGGALAVVGT